MIRLTTIASGGIGLGCGAVGMAVSRGPLNAFATGATGALVAGITTYSLWNKYGKNCLARYIAKAVDAALKEQKEPIHQIVATSMESIFPMMISPTSIVDNAIKSVVNSCIDHYSTDPHTVRNILDDLDRRVPYENRIVLSGFVNQVTKSILDAKCSGYCKPLQSFLRKPLNRIVATVAANILKTIKEAVIEKCKESFAGKALNAVEKLAKIDLKEAVKAVVV